MKHVIVLSLLLSNTISGFAYHSIFGQNSTIWEVQYGTCFFTDGVRPFYIEKDTIVNGLIYKKIKDNTFLLGIGLLREDTVNGNVWYKKIDSKYDSSEMLILNYSLQKGDTFEINANTADYPWPDIPDSLKIVDSIYYESGIKHIQFKASPIFPLLPFTMIEGAGSNYSVLYADSNPCYSYLLNCSYKDNVKQYNKYCIDVNVNNVLSGHNDIYFYPQPAHDKIYLNNLKEVESIQIYNLQGKSCIYFKSIVCNKIDISELPSGVYIAIIVLKNGEKLNKKVVVQN